MVFYSVWKVNPIKVPVAFYVQSGVYIPAKAGTKYTPSLSVVVAKLYSNSLKSLNRLKVYLAQLIWAAPTSIEP